MDTYKVKMKLICVLPFDNYKLSRIQIDIKAKLTFRIISKQAKTLVFPLIELTNCMKPCERFQIIGADIWNSLHLFVNANFKSKNC